MIEILLWRHAKSEERSAGMRDHERRLTATGRDDAREVGQILADRGLVPDAVICSDSARTRETADLALASMGVRPEVRFDLPDLYGGDASDYLAAAATYGEASRRLLLVGHNPSVEELVSAVAGTHVPMKTGYLALFRADVHRAAELRAAGTLTLHTILTVERREKEPQGG